LTGRPESEFPRLVDGGAVPSKSDDFGSVACKITTREYYPGVHLLEIQVNGKVLAKKEWTLVV
jgi:hypothetical protein